MRQRNGAGTEGKGVGAAVGSNVSQYVGSGVARMTAVGFGVGSAVVGSNVGSAVVGSGVMRRNTGDRVGSAVVGSGVVTTSVTVGATVGVRVVGFGTGCAVVGVQVGNQVGVRVVGRGVPGIMVVTATKEGTMDMRMGAREGISDVTSSSSSSCCAGHKPHVAGHHRYPG